MRRWILNCDDFGMHPTINRATLRLLEGGLVKSCSLMAVGQFFEQAVTDFRALGGRGLGVHLALQGEYARLPVRPVLPPADLPSLVDKNGFLKISGPPPDPQEALRELRAQIDRVRDNGLRITHLDGHMFFYDQNEWGESLRNGVEGLAAELGVPIRFKENALFIWEGYDTSPLRHRYYDSLIESGGEGRLEILLHPADNAEEMAAFSTAGIRRTADFDFFSQAGLGGRLKNAGIELSGWGEVW